MMARCRCGRYIEGDWWVDDRGTCHSRIGCIPYRVTALYLGDVQAYGAPPKARGS